MKAWALMMLGTIVVLQGLQLFTQVDDSKFMRQQFGRRVETTYAIPQVIRTARRIDYDVPPAPLANPGPPPAPETSPPTSLPEGLEDGDYQLYEHATEQGWKWDGERWVPQV